MEPLRRRIKEVKHSLVVNLQEGAAESERRLAALRARLPHREAHVIGNVRKCASQPRAHVHSPVASAPQCQKGTPVP